METKFTAGPIESAQHYTPDYPLTSDLFGPFFFELTANDRAVTLGYALRSGEANLWAAAPDLLAALENAVVLVHHLANGLRTTEVDVAQAKAALPLIYAAIAKATGK